MFVINIKTGLSIFHFLKIKSQKNFNPIVYVHNKLRNIFKEKILQTKQRGHVWVQKQKFHHQDVNKHLLKL